MIQQGELWADILRQVHPFTFNCIYGLNQDLWESNVKIIYAKSVLYILDFWLENDEFIFQDMIQIYNLTFDAVFNGQLYLLFDYELLFGAILLLRANLPEDFINFVDEKMNDNSHLFSFITLYYRGDPDLANYDEMV